MSKARGVLISFATDPDNVAQEAPGRGGGYYTSALLKYLTKPGMSITDTLTLVNDDVQRATGNAQVPYIESGLNKLLYLVPKGPDAPPVPTPAPTPAFDAVAQASRQSPFVNTLGQEFVPVPGTGVLMCNTTTRVADFRAYARATGYRQTPGVAFKTALKRVDGKYSFTSEKSDSMTWEQPGFAQHEDEPIICVDWNEARAFCDWLSKKEDRRYRLPTDKEWSAAVGTRKYPWGSTWPPARGTANYCGPEFYSSFGQDPKGWSPAYEYSDGYPRTAPAKSFPPNSLGLYQMGGNVWQWCEDSYRTSMNDSEVLSAQPDRKEVTDSKGNTCRVMRGASWYDSNEMNCRSSFRYNFSAALRDDNTGFRIVLETSSKSPGTTATVHGTSGGTGETPNSTDTVNMLFPRTAPRQPNEKFPETRLRRLSEEEVGRWSLDDLRTALNEMIARYGGKLNERFHMEDVYPWYKVQTTMDLEEIPEKLFSELEYQNYTLMYERRDVLMHPSAQ